MRERLIIELKEFFNYDKDKSIRKLKDSYKIKSIKGLGMLISYLNEERISPKILAQQLEDVIVCLLMEKDPDPFKKKLLSLLKAIQNNPEFNRNRPILNMNIKKF